MPTNSIIRRVTIPSGTYDIADERLKTELVEGVTEINPRIWSNEYYPVCQSYDNESTTSSRLWTGYFSFKRTSYQINGHNGDGMTLHLTGNNSGNGTDAYIRLNHDAVHPSSTSSTVNYDLPQHQGIILSSGDCLGTVSGASYGSVTTTTYWPCSYQDGTLYAPIVTSGGGGGDTVVGHDVTLSTTSSVFMTVNGANSYEISLPSSIPSIWLGTEETEAAKGDHRHGNWTRNGFIRGNSSQAGGTGNDQVDIGNGDRIIIADYSTRESTNYYEPKMTSIVFDGSTTTQFLSKKGTWETPSGGGGGSTVSYTTADIISPGPANMIGTIYIDNIGTSIDIPPARVYTSGGSSDRHGNGTIKPISQINITNTDEITTIERAGQEETPNGTASLLWRPDMGGKINWYALPITVLAYQNSDGDRFESVPVVLVPESMIGDVASSWGSSMMLQRRVK